MNQINEQQFYCQKINCEKQTYSLVDGFRNLNDPLKFCQNQRISKIKNNIKQIKTQFQKCRQNAASLSHFNYKNVISRDSNSDQFFQQDSIQTSTKGDFQQEDIEKQFMEERGVPITKQKNMHNYIHNISTVKDFDDEVLKETMQFKHIKMIGTPEFKNQCKNIQFYDYVTREPEELRQVNQIIQIGDNRNIQQEIDKLKFIQKTQDCYYSQKSDLYLYNVDVELNFWKNQTNRGNNDKNKNFKSIENDNDDEFNKKCHLVDFDKNSIMNVLDYSSLLLNDQDIRSYELIKKKRQEYKKLSHYNQNLQVRYKQLLKDIQYEKQKASSYKTTRMFTKNLYVQSQTLSKIDLKQIADHFQTKIQDLLQKLDTIDLVVKTIILQQSKKVQKIMLTNSNIQIKSILLNLLFLITQGQQFFDERIVVSLNDQQAQNALLEMIYLNMSNFKVEKIQGVKKSDILIRYLNQRENRYKISELLSKID